MESESISRLEDLPDELLLVISSYLSVVEILYAFCCLNTRLSRTISQFTNEIDLNSIPSKVLPRFLADIFPQIASNVQSLIIPDRHRCPVDLRSFPNLRSIHLLNSCSTNLLLNVEQIKIDLVSVELQVDLVQKFFTTNEHSALKSLSLSSFHGLSFANIDVSNWCHIEDLTITVKNNSDLFALLRLVSSSIERLYVHINYNGPFSSTLASTTVANHLRSFHLKTTFEDAIQFRQLQSFILTSFVTLERLSVETLTRDRDYVNGNRWELFLRKLVRLKCFTCAIRFRFQLNEDDDDQREQEKVLNSFSNNFWLNERHWNVQCYSSMSITDENAPMGTFYQTKKYGKLFLHTIPYAYSSMDATIDLNRARQTSIETNRRIYFGVRHLYFDGHNQLLTVDALQNVLKQFKSITELKLDRVVLDSSSATIVLRHLNKLTVYNNLNGTGLNVDFLLKSSSHNLRYIRLPQSSVPHFSLLPIRLESLVITDCRDLRFDFVYELVNLRSLKLYLLNLDRLLENDGQLIIDLIDGLFSGHKNLEFLQLMCHGANVRKMNALEKRFNKIGNEHLHAGCDGKSFIVLRDCFQK